MWFLGFDMVTQLLGPVELIIKTHWQYHVSVLSDSVVSVFAFLLISLYSIQQY